MMQYIYAFLLGIVEGVTEFLPVSSTAHLRLSQYFLGIPLDDEFWKLFAIFIQLGAILSVVVFYWARLLAFSRSALACGIDFSKWKRHPFTMIGLAFLCTAIPALLLKKVIGENLESLVVICASLFIGGLVMLGVDKYFGKKGISSIEEIRPWQAIMIGLIQVLSAVFPGTSRSMSTIAGGQLVGLSRVTALEFSFFLSIPVMAAATLYDLYKYTKEESAHLSIEQMLVLSIGFVVSFVVAYIVIAWFLDYVKRKGFFLFGVYRIAAAAVLYILLLR